jgi:hypothetical protein
MPKTTSLLDCRRLADAVSAAGGEVPPILANTSYRPTTC